jgi:hypothetical protein
MKLLFAAIIAAAFTIPAPALAGVSWEDASEATALRVIDSIPDGPMHVTVRPMPNVRTDITAATPFFVNFVATAPSQNGVPCFSCVNGGQADTMGVTVPYNYVVQNSYQNYLVSWTAVNFYGSCHVSFAITAAGRVIDKFAGTFKGLGDGAFAAWEDRPTTGYSGPAIVMAKVKCYGRTTFGSIAKAPVLYQ